MYIDTDLSRHRISTTSKAYLGYQAFIRKHSSDLNAYNLLSLKYNDLINRKEKFSILKFELLRKPFLLLGWLKKGLSIITHIFILFTEKYLNKEKGRYEKLFKKLRLIIKCFQIQYG
ncbi:hypothetical protein HPE41_13630 [Escherichia coli]|nr:hypothetical protein HPE41_13630 [Escherichia coli]